METPADRAYRLAAHHVRPALPFPLLVDLLRQEGCPVTAGVLLAALRADPDRFRLLDPWRGTLGALAALGYQGALPEARSGPGARSGPVARSGRVGMVPPAEWMRSPAPHPSAPQRSGSGADGVRLLVVALSPALSRAAPDRARWAVTLLGRELDEASALDRSRWLRLLSEAGRISAVA